MDVAPIATEPIPWQSAAVPASSVDMFAVGVSSTTTAGNDDSWADFGGNVMSSAAADQSSADDESGWADFASFDSVQPQSCSTR